MWNVVFFLFLKFSMLLISLIKDRLRRMNFCALHFVCFCFNLYSMWTRAKLFQVNRIYEIKWERWEMNSQITSKFWLQPKRRRREGNAEGVNKDSQIENTKKWCLQRVVVTCLCKMDSCNLHHHYCPFWFCPAISTAPNSGRLHSM